MQLRGAVSSHVGNVRENNQDRAHFGGYIAAVADGMGGHQGGETAASIAIKEFLTIVDPIAPGGLVELVEDANRAVFEQAADPDLRGMGTTLVALTLRPAEEKISVVNVGDSRAYFFRDGELVQLTLDHSLVEDLVRQKRLTKEEALHHPQRNILTRALGIASHVEVDRFLFEARVGDRYLLCSDGLFNEVEEHEIARILGARPEPDAAADQLVAAALAGAGRDNVTVTIVDVVEDGHGASLMNRSADTLMVPVVPSHVGGEFDNGANSVAASVRDTQPAAGVGLDVADSGYEQTDGQEMGTVEFDQPYDTAYDDEPYGASSFETAELPRIDQGEPRRGRLGPSIAVAGLVALLAAIAYLGVGVYANRGFYVGVDPATKEVAIFQGRPGGLLWAQPLLTEPTKLAVADLTQEGQAKVAQEQTFGSKNDAVAFVEGLRASDVEEEVDPDTVESLLDGAQSEPPEGTTPTDGAGTDTTDPGTTDTTTGSATDTEGAAADPGAATGDTAGTSAGDATGVGASALSIAEVASTIDIGS